MIAHCYGNIENESNLHMSEETELLNKAVLILLDTLKTKMDEDTLIQAFTDKLIEHRKSVAGEEEHIDDSIIHEMLMGRTEYLYSLDNK